MTACNLLLKQRIDQRQLASPYLFLDGVGRSPSRPIAAPLAVSLQSICIQRIVGLFERLLGLLFLRLLIKARAAMPLAGGGETRPV